MVLAFHCEIVLKVALTLHFQFEVQVSVYFHLLCKSYCVQNSGLLRGHQLYRFLCEHTSGSLVIRFQIGRKEGKIGYWQGFALL